MSPAKGLVQLKIYVPPEWREALNRAIPANERGQFIREAVEEKFKRDYGLTLPGAVAPQGVRSDVLPMGWKSRLYQDRYQLVAKWNPNAQEFDLAHMHDNQIGIGHGFKTLRADNPHKVEVYVYAPPHLDQRDVQQALFLQVTEFLSNE